MSRSATLRLRVRFGETDAAGIVYYGTYISWFDAGTSHLIRVPGMASTDVHGRPAYPLPLVEIGATFHAPLRYDQEIDLTSRVAAIGTTSLRVEHEVRMLDGTLAGRGFEARVFCRIVEGAFLKEPIPAELRSHLEGSDAV